MRLGVGSRQSGDSSKAAVTRRAFQMRDARGILGDRFAVELRDIEARRCARFRRSRAGDSFTNTPTRRTPGRRESRAALFGRDVARAARIEIEADGGGARVDGRRCILRVGDAADFDHHAATSFRSARGGIARFHQMLAHQERVDPAARKRGDIARVVNAALADLNAPAGMCSARRSEVSSVTSKVVRSRLFTPMISAPEAMRGVEFARGRGPRPARPCRYRAASSRKSRSSRSVEDRGDQQNRVGAMRRGFDDVRCRRW